MPVEAKDIVAEARELLAQLGEWHDAPLSACAPELLKEMADEIERLRGELDDAYFDRNECGGRA